MSIMKKSEAGVMLHRSASLSCVESTQTERLDSTKDALARHLAVTSC